MDSLTRQTAYKNTYRVLLTRGLLGCAVYFEDEETGDLVRSRIDWSRRTG